MHWETKTFTTFFFLDQMLVLDLASPTDPRALKVCMKVIP